MTLASGGASLNGSAFELPYKSANCAGSHFPTVTSRRSARVSAVSRHRKAPRAFTDRRVHALNAARSSSQRWRGRLGTARGTARVNAASGLETRLADDPVRRMPSGRAASSPTPWATSGNGSRAAATCSSTASSWSRCSGGHSPSGVRDDNRPENLELWAKQQPPGQRLAEQRHCTTCTCGT